MKNVIIVIVFLSIGLGSSFAQSQLMLTTKNIDNIVAAMTLEEKVKMCCGIGSFYSKNNGTGVAGAAGGVAKIERFGFPETYLADGPFGLRILEKRKNSDKKYQTVNFPSSILIASSWDTEAAKLIGSTIGEECKEYNISVLLAPAMNILRFPLGGRTAEYFSEDPLLTGKIAAAYVRGVQSVGIGASIKHFACNNQETARKLNDVRISMRPLRELYLRGFEIAVKEAQPWTVMSSYNKINGVYTSENQWLLEDVLRSEWGFKGLVMSDWDAGWDGAAQMKAGNDLVEPGYEMQSKAIIKAVKNGTLSESELNRNVKRLLEYVIKTPAYAGYKFSDNPDIAKHIVTARKVAAESMILLKNTNALPMNHDTKVAIYGNTAYNYHKGIESKNISLQKGLLSAGFRIDSQLISLYENYLGIIEPKEGEAALKDGMLLTSFDVSSSKQELCLTIEQLKKQTSDNNYAIVFLSQSAGESLDCKSTDFTLSDNELKLIENVCTAYHEAGKKVVVVLNIAIPVETTSWKEKPDAIICSWQSGQEMGNAIADVVSGTVNPSGKLTVSFPVRLSDSPAYDNFPVDITYDWVYAQHGFLPRKRLPENEPVVRNVHYTDYKEGIYVGYRYFDTKKVDVSYPFGYGLSYTTFSYSNATVKRSKGEWIATVKVTNTGKVAGREVVELYVAAPGGKIDKPEKELKSFAKTRLLKPGESETATMKFTDYMLSSFDEKDNHWIADEGKYKALFAASSLDIRQTVEFILKKKFDVDIHNHSLNF
jgi:Beta-glucosidase-related glycosidases